jgi:hypothetical protein
MSRLLASFLLPAALLLGACGGEDKTIKTDKNRAEADARSSLGVIREAILSHFRKQGSIPEKASVSTFGIDQGLLRKNWYSSYDFELNGDKEDGYPGTRIIARPKEGTVAPVVTLEFQDMRKADGFTVRVD